MKLLHGFSKCKFTAAFSKVGLFVNGCRPKKSKCLLHPSAVQQIHVRESLTAAEQTRISQSLGKVLLHSVTKTESVVIKKATKTQIFNLVNFNLVTCFCQLVPGAC